MQEQQIDHSRITSKVNNLSTLADQNSYHCFEPIHSLSQSILTPIKHKKRSPQKPAFGTSSNRQVKELKSNKLTDVVAYSRINYEKNQKYKDRYEQVQPKLTPFLTTSSRFSNNKKFNPGPGAYKFPQIFKNDLQSKKNQSAMFCPFKKWQVKERKITGRNDQAEKRQILQNNKQNLEQIDRSLQLKIKQKRDEMKEKMLKLKQMMKKSQPQLKPDFKRMGYRVENQNNSDDVRLEENQHQNEQKMQQAMIVTDLKQITSKYMPKNQYNFEREQFRTGSEIKNYREKYNNMPVFLQGNLKLFSSYINPSQTPGPGYYEKKTKKLPKHDLSGCQKIFL